MMRTFRLIVPVSVTLVLSIGPPTLSSGEGSVGRFLQKLAEAKRVEASDERLAVKSLSANGFRLPAGLDLAKRLTQSDVVEISRAVGLSLSTSRPDAIFDETEVEAFFVVFGPELGPGGRSLAGDRRGADGVVDDDIDGDGDGPPFDPFSKGKGKGKRPATPTDP